MKLSTLFLAFAQATIALSSAHIASPSPDDEHGVLNATNPDTNNELIARDCWNAKREELSVDLPWDTDAGTCDPNSDDWGDAFQCQIAQAHADISSLTLSRAPAPPSVASGPAPPSVASNPAGLSPKLASTTLSNIPVLGSIARRPGGISPDLARVFNPKTGGQSAYARKP
ncbi:MAG: hypothetical protein L6R37_008144 [Teloschistes peruensis]|nr:MAG: hypothetical protein L6R37_008144 [Teloschistes peruensis]